MSGATRVRPPIREDAPALYGIYRRAAARVPHSRFTCSEAAFAAVLAQPPLAGTEVLVAEAGGRVRGMASLLLLRGKPDAEDEDERASRLELTSCFAEDEAAEEALVRVCVLRAEERAAEHQAATGEALATLYGFPQEHGRGPVRAHNADWGGLSDRQASLGRVLVRAGFVPVYRELHLELTRVRFPDEAPAPSGLGDVSLLAGPPRGPQRRTAIRLMRGEEELGLCIYSTLAHITDHPDAARWGCVHWLGTAESVRRRGVARHLLTRALADLAAHGAEGCWLTTGAANWEAQPLYLSMGFEVVDTSACFTRRLAVPESAAAQGRGSPD